MAEIGVTEQEAERIGLQAPVPVSQILPGVQVPVQDEEVVIGLQLVPVVVQVRVPVPQLFTGTLQVQVGVPVQSGKVQTPFTQV